MKITNKHNIPNKVKWAIVCDNCYREQYCCFVCDAKYCLLFRPKEKTDVSIITKQ